MYICAQCCLHGLCHDNFHLRFYVTPLFFHSFTPWSWCSMIDDVTQILLRMPNSKLCWLHIYYFEGAHWLMTWPQFFCLGCPIANCAGSPLFLFIVVLWVLTDLRRDPNFCLGCPIANSLLLFLFSFFFFWGCSLIDDVTSHYFYLFCWFWGCSLTDDATPNIFSWLYPTCAK